MKTKWSLLFSIFFLTISINAASLWAKSSQKSWYVEDKAHQIGDILTVVVYENAQATQTSAKNTNKKYNGSLNAGTGFLSKIKAGSASSSEKFAGQGNTVASGNIKTTLSVKVVAVLPNGNLVVEGSKYININNEIQEIKLKGEVRPRDINADNTVNSVLIANAKIIYKGKGDIIRSQRPNLFQRILGLIF